MRTISALSFFNQLQADYHVANAATKNRSHSYGKCYEKIAMLFTSGPELAFHK